MRFLRSGVRGFAFFGITCSSGECKNRVRAEYDKPAGEIDQSRMISFSGGAGGRSMRQPTLMTGSKRPFGSL